MHSKVGGVGLTFLQDTAGYLNVLIIAKPKVNLGGECLSFRIWNQARLQHPPVLWTDAAVQLRTPLMNVQENGLSFHYTGDTHLRCGLHF